MTEDNNGIPENNPKKGQIIVTRKSRLILLLAREMDDHGVWRIGTLFVVLTIMIASLSWGIGWGMGWDRSSFLGYTSKAFGQLYLNVFGGELVYDRSYKVYDSLDAFEQKGYNAFDVSAINLYTTATSYRKGKFEEILKRPGGRIRILVLDPRMALRSDTRKAFSTMSSNFGDPDQITFAECYLSTLALIQAKKELSAYGSRFQVRFYNKPYHKAAEGYFILGRSYHKYSVKDKSRRFDLIVPYGNKSEKNIDSGLRRTYLIKNSPDNPRVVKYTKAFEDVWNTATPISEVARNLPNILSLKLRADKATEGS